MNPWENFHEFPFQNFLQIIFYIDIFISAKMELGFYVVLNLYIKIKNKEYASFEVVIK